MATLASWFGPVRGLGNAGAVANAGRACRQRRQAEASTDAALRNIVARLSERAEPADSAESVERLRQTA